MQPFTACAVLFAFSSACAATPRPKEAQPERQVPHPPTDGTGTVAAPPATGARTEPTQTPAARGASGTTTLDVPGFDAAVLSFPSTDREREPVVMVAHGAGGTPDEQCRTWRELLGDRGVVLCIAGRRVAVHSEERYFPDHFALERIALASLEALRRAFPNVNAEHVVYAGYSQGATMGSLMIASHGDDCPRLALLEGGFDGWTLSRAQKFEASGGRRVLFVCGTRHCADRARAAASTLVRTGVPARVESDLSAGHTYGGGVEQKLSESWRLLIEDDDAWK